ncbi:hypothetical protein [Halorarius litoreus]|uniref:hypothetical protein n=1 Tax=Halorarius litoreus TaxID=2962676 RepID=UPI0020CC97FF|nr:hypothetical protein [Halorarius litoreus]
MKLQTVSQTGKELTDLVQQGTDVLRNEGIVPFVSVSSLYAGRPLWNTVTSRRPLGTNIFEREWDLLIILDACRVDALRKYANTVDFLGYPERMWSVGSMSYEFALNTFRTQYSDVISETAYVCRNSLPDKILVDQIHTNGRDSVTPLSQGYPKWDTVTAETFAHYELVRPIANHADKALHPDCRTVPHVATDRAIAVGRSGDFDRMIVHYNSPHLRFITNAIDWSPDETSMETLMNGPDPIRDLEPEEKSYKPVKRGEVSRKTMFELYYRELQFIMDYVQILLENVDAENVAITADHGEGLGEMGIWGHPFGWPFPPVKTVPWATTTASNEGTYDPHFEPVNRQESDEEHKEFLKEMGYL